MTTQAPMNRLVTRHAEIMGRHGEGERWAEVLLEDGRNRAVWISGPPGTPSDPHIHPDFNEFWVALDGRTQWQIGQYESVLSEWGDIIMAPAGFAHDIKGIAPCRLIPVDEGQTNPNLIHTKLKSLIERNGTSSNWEEVAVSDNRNHASYTHDMPGTSSEFVSHPDENRWWVILQGQVDCSVDGEGVSATVPGDVVFIEKGKRYSTSTTGDQPSIRITIAAPVI